MFFTQWTLFITILFFATACIGQTVKSDIVNKAHEFLFQIAMVANICVVLLYWTLLYKEDMKRPELVADAFRRLISCLLHIWPCLGVLVDFKLSNNVMNKNDGWKMAPILISYCLVNY